MIWLTIVEWLENVFWGRWWNSWLFGSGSQHKFFSIHLAESNLSKLPNMRWWNQITIFVCAFFLTRPFEDQQGLREGSGRNQDRDWRVAWGKQDDAVKLEIFIWFPSKYKERHVLCSCLSPSLIWNVYHAWVVVLGEAVKTLKCRKIMSDQSIIQSLPQSNWNSVCQQKTKKRNLTFSWEIPKVHIRNGTVDSNTNRINY